MGGTAIQLGLDGLLRAVRVLGKDKTLALVKVAEELAGSAGEGGITVSDIRLEATRRGIIIDNTPGLSGLGVVPKLAGLVQTGQMRRSTIPSTHGRYQMVWRLP